jgi:hypothetical protein
MKISKTHQNFADRIQKLYGKSSQDILDRPENYLGLNWGDVINFWLYLDTLTEDQLRDVLKRYYALSSEECRKAWSAAADATDFADDAETAAYYSVSCASSAAYQATCELIGLEKLLEKGHQPVFFPMFLNS